MDLLFTYNKDLTLLSLSFLFVLTPDERPPLLKGHFCSAEGVASQKG